ncbi:serine/threonine-protein kinase ULK3 [Lingula anatina]|uniref:Serine/threonine-protein kinase ULK3 n=1 Tax=Lingula anatina TaxID=7574 RepID=A0A2R2MJA4_LINAN|nr:serine/threonine-protein kinase ULK3 [Lingula anatina]|eukprot:XP_023930157.1 serine/threonine-protein kinase ULK3 [Lingula anatina]
MANSIKTPKLRDFVFTDKLGSGTYATVYKAYRKGGPREVVAIKCIQKDGLNRLSTENLLVEIELLKKLKHEYIVELKDFLWDDNFIYLIMEYCSGGDLLGFIQSRRALPENIVRKFLRQIAKALQYMRENEVSHMDLKPQNLLLSSNLNPVLKIGDFGFARYLQGDVEGDMLRGTPLYMAPEVVCKRQYDPKADLWSVGVILYECLFGKAPFASRSLKELGEKIRDTKPVEIPFGVNISDGCRDLLLRLLQREPEKRISFEDFFSHPYIDLEHIPSKNSLNEAISLAKAAVEKDTEKKYKEAVTLYCKALEHFIPAIHYEPNPTKKQRLREKVREYMKRAEELKQCLKPEGRHTNQKQLTPRSKQELETFAAEDETLKAALTMIEVAEYKEDYEKYEEALAKYEMALGVLIKLLQDEANERKKELLSKHVSVWMTKAETIKNYLKVKQLKTRDTSEQEEEEDQRLSGHSCNIQ